MVKHSLHKHTVSFSHAWDGIKNAFINQPNFRIHCLIGSLVIIAGLIFELTQTEWVIITFTILWILLIEMINTAIESVVDLVTSEHRLEAKIAKDVAAGAVLLSAVGSVVIACLIFLPKLVGMF